MDRCEPPRTRSLRYFVTSARGRYRENIAMPFDVTLHRLLHGWIAPKLWQSAELLTSFFVTVTLLVILGTSLGRAFELSNQFECGLRCWTTERSVFGSYGA